MRDLPAWNIDAEKAVLGSIFLDPDAISKIIYTLHPSDFLRSEHRVLYEAMLTLTSRRIPIDIVTILDYLEGKGQIKAAGGMAYIHTLVTLVPTAIHVAHYAEIVRRNGQKLELISQLTHALTMAYKPETTPEECWAAIPQQTRIGTQWNVHSIQLPHASHARSR